MPSNDPAADDVDNNDILPSLIDGSPFKIKPDEEKLTILQKGRPTPKLAIIKRDSAKNCNRTFQESWYGIHKWLCGSTQYNKLFCWPCTLMRPESSSWCSTGNDDMKRLSSMASKHSTCKSHVKAISEYDAVLVGFGLVPEFVNETNFGCKEEQETNQQSDSEEDYFDMYFNEESKSKRIKNESDANTNKQKNLAQERKKSAEPQATNASKPQITFKAWQEMSKSSFPISQSQYVENKKLFKWKRKIAKQELRNARLTGQKLRYEIELMKTKLEYQKSLLLDQNTEESGKQTLQAPLIVPISAIQATSVQHALQ